MKGFAVLARFRFLRGATVVKFRKRYCAVTVVMRRRAANRTMLQTVPRLLNTGLVCSSVRMFAAESSIAGNIAARDLVINKKLIHRIAPGRQT
jgi:hypothetical protein